MTYSLRPHQQDMLDAMAANDKGIIQCPTGGGKTYTFITDARRHLQPGSVVVVVAPQLLLSEQLFREFDTHLQDVNFMWRQVSSEGKTFQRQRRSLRFRVTPPPAPTTAVEDIRESYRIAQKQQRPLILFSTYASVDRVVSSLIDVDAVYYDEAHNATSSDVFEAVSALSAHAKHNYFFTATPRYSPGHSSAGAGMDNTKVYGEFIARVDFNDLVSQGVIVRPKVHLMKSDANTDTDSEVNVNAKSIREAVEHYETTYEGNHKLLFCCGGTKSITELLNSSLMDELRTKGYRVLSIDSVNQGYVDGDRGVSKAAFIKRLDELGADVNEKLVVLHHSMLGEGIDVKAFTGVVFLRRSMSQIFATQSIGRVIRSAPGKQFGVVTVVEHENGGHEARELIRHIVRSLIENGVPDDVFLGESQGRAEEEETVESLDDDVAKLIKDTVYEWQHSNMLAELLRQEELPTISF